MANYIGRPQSLIWCGSAVPVFPFLTFVHKRSVFPHSFLPPFPLVKIDQVEEKKSSLQGVISPCDSVFGQRDGLGQ